MGLFSKKETLIRSMPLMGLMAAINVIFAAITAYVPVLFISVVLVIFIPLTSTLVEFYCKDKYFPIYAFATLGLSLIVTLSAIDFTLFYLVPSILTGYVFGLMAKKNFANHWGILIAAVIQTGLSFAFIPLVQLITERNLIDVLRQLFKAENSPYFNNLIGFMFFVVSLIQTILSFIVVDNELKKFGGKNESKNEINFYVDLACILSIGIAVGLHFVYVPISLIFLCFSVYFAVFLILRSIQNQCIPALVLMGLVVIANIFFFAGLNKLLPAGNEFILLGFTPFCIAIISLVFYFLQKKKN